MLLTLGAPVSADVCAFGTLCKSLFSWKERMPALLLRPLPLGRSTFSTLRAKHELYVDKTDLIFELCRYDAKIFLSRPRRFGKSLLVSTFESLFKHGLRDFEGLAIEPLWQDHTYSVLRLDFSLVRDFESIQDFSVQFEHMLEDAALQAGLTVPKTTAGPFGRFASMLSRLPDSSLVLLIDEYDAPLTAHLGDHKLFESVQLALSRFYAAVKSYEGCLRFFFMTGITKLANTGIFSSFNNMTDISSDPRYGTLLGYTEQELADDFSAYLQRAADRLQCSMSVLKGRLKDNYNGFCFDEAAQTRVYCPWSILNFCASPERGFQNYWYQSGGQPMVLLKYLQSHKLENPSTFNRPIGVGLDVIGASQQYAGISQEALLVQSGYLTIKKLLMPGYVEVGYPNQEVASSMARLYADELLRSADRMELGLPAVSSTMAEGALEDIVSLFNKTFNAIDYQRYPVTDEHACRAFLQVLLLGAAMMPQVEVHAAHGRSDLEVDAGSRRWVFEIKCARTKSEVDKLLHEGIRQVQGRHYGETLHGKTLCRAVLVFERDCRRFSAWSRADLS